MSRVPRVRVRCPIVRAGRGGEAGPEAGGGGGGEERAEEGEGGEVGGGLWLCVAVCVHREFFAGEKGDGLGSHLGSFSHQILIAYHLTYLSVLFFHVFLVFPLA